MQITLEKDEMVKVLEQYVETLLPGYTAKIRHDYNIVSSCEFVLTEPNEAEIDQLEQALAGRYSDIRVVRPANEPDPRD